LFSISYLVYFNIRSCKKTYWSLYLGHKWMYFHKWEPVVLMKAINQQRKQT
jgi:hypothetical protein